MCLNNTIQSEFIFIVLFSSFWILSLWLKNQFPSMILQSFHLVCHDNLHVFQENTPLVGTPLVQHFIVVSNLDSSLNYSYHLHQHQQLQ